VVEDGLDPRRDQVPDVRCESDRVHERRCGDQGLLALEQRGGVDRVDQPGEHLRVTEADDAVQDRLRDRRQALVQGCGRADQPPGHGGAVPGGVRRPSGDRARTSVVRGQLATRARVQPGQRQRVEARQPLHLTGDRAHLLLQLVERQGGEVLLDDGVDRRAKGVCRTCHGVTL
jgi:hypothetical protein